MDEIFNRQQEQKLRNISKRPQSSRTSAELSAMKSKPTTAAITTIADNRCDDATATAVNSKSHASASTVITSPDVAKQSDSHFNETIVVSGDSNLITTRTTTPVVLESNHRTSPPMLDSTRIITKVDSIVSLNHCETTTQLNGRTLAV